jgi:myo-inositol-1(or 4)-monophosphatase
MTEIEQKFQDLITHIETMGQHARDYFDSDDTENDVKEDGSVVTRIDNEIETMLRSYIRDNFPGDAIVGEEHDDTEGTTGFVWHIDPIDGTDNFLRKIPFCAISVARLGDTAEDSFAIIHNPITKHTFASLMENGVYENERIANLRKEPLGGRVTITLGVGRESWMKPAGYRIQEAISVTYGGRCKDYGSTALQLAYVAAGRLDGIITFGLGSYDWAAGLALVRAAGGTISVFEEGKWRQWDGPLKELCNAHKKTIFASHPDTHDSLRDFIGNPKDWVLDKS